MNLGQAFNPRRNALNALRLAMAAEVMLFHSFPITGHMPPQATLQLLFSVGVDGFFAVSGFLITASWLNDPRLRDYLVARALRILPGFYVCLLVVAFVIAPISVMISGGSAARLLMSTGPIEFVLKNSAVAYLHPNVGNTPRGVPLAHGGWNASLWSLIWEIVCYLAVACIGIAGLANRRWVSPLILALAVIGATQLPPLTFTTVWTIPQLLARCATMFAAGAVLFQWRDVIPARWSFVGVSIGIVLASSQLPDYRVVAALPLAYAIVVSGILIRNDRLRLRTDLSYGVYIYAYPIQQLLATMGLIRLSPFVFFVVALTVTLPLAALSWFLVEKPAQRLKARLKRKWSFSALSETGSDSAVDPLADRPSAPEASDTA